MKYELSELELTNLMVFLDRVPVQGHQEREAMNQICLKLSTAVQEEPSEGAAQQLLE